MPSEALIACASELAILGITLIDQYAIRTVSKC